MVRHGAISEYLLTKQTAEEYRCKGYEVVLEAPLHFFPGFTADLLVRKGDEVKVIEVKSRPSLAADPRIGELARIIESKPGWTFELVLVSEPEKLDSPAGARSFGYEDIVHRFKEAERSLEAGLPEAAFLLAWSAHEAAIRVVFAEQGITESGLTGPHFVLSQAVIHGVIAREEYKTLKEMMKYRNAIVHGFSLSDFRDDLVIDLIASGRRIIAAASDTNDDGQRSVSR
jgi:hypothetical protein